MEVRGWKGEPVSIVDALDGAERAFLVDAVRSGAAPEDGSPARRRRGAGAGDALRRLDAHARGRRSDRAGEDPRTPPGAVVLYGIEAESIAAGDELTPAVAQAVDAVVEEVLAECTSSR